MDNQQMGLYSPEFEHDNCGIGAVVSIKGIKTHQTVSDALKIVENLEHRAGKDALGETGDGVGILLQISHKFFSKVTKEIGISIGGERDYGVGMFFFPGEELKRKQAMKMFEIIVEKENREKATSNICSNESLMALWVTVYLSLMGPEGMKQVNDLCYQRSHYLYTKLIETGKFEPVFKDAVFLKEFVLKSKAPAAQVQKKLADAGFLGALETEEGYVTFCVTEKRSYADIDLLVELLAISY